MITIKQIHLIRSLTAALLLLLPAVNSRGESSEQQRKQQLQFPSYFLSYDEVIQFKRMIQSLPRTFDPSNPTETCYTPLYNSNINGDGVVSIDEYPIFIRELSDGVIDVTSFSDLPFVLQVNFVYLSCLCEVGIDDSNITCCSNGGLSTAGTGPGETPTPTEMQYLNIVCSDTQASVDYAIEDGVPTRKPATSNPTPLTPVTTHPSASPTKKPTIEPTTSSPSKKPTVPPSAAPVTPAPVTTAPAKPPTSSPVITPVTKAPSLPPFVGTKSPSSTTESPVATAPTTLGPNVAVPTFPSTMNPTPIKLPTVPTPESPSPTFEFQPSMQPSILLPINPGEKPDNGNTSFEPLAPGAVAGIVLACVGVAVVGVLVTRKRKREGNDPSLGDLSVDKNRDLEAGEGKGPSMDSPGRDPAGSDSSHLSSLGSPDVDEDMDEVGNYVPQTREASPPRDPALVPIVAGMPSSPKSRRAVDSNDDSSSAGASGWSSSAGMSSLNTSSLADASLASASFDVGMDDGLSTGSPTKTLAAVAAASAVVAQTARVTRDDVEPLFIPLDGSGSTGDENSSPNSPVGIQSTPQGEVSREDLDKAIEAGDWAAVGATAALLAVKRKSSFTKIEKASLEEEASCTSDVDESSNSNEMDALVAAGDWQGVVLAASKIEEGRSADNRFLDEDTISSGYTGDSRGERDLSEIRSEVELLVSRVVPDEVDNTDEMMMQFKNREEELVETLRTMQERTVAQRARHAIRKSAKMEAKARALENREEQRSRSDSLSSDYPSF